MKKKDFVTLLLSVVGGLLFAIGMCMALIPEWNAMKPGIVVAAVGIVVLLIMVMVHRKMSGKAAIQFNLKTIDITLYGILATLVLGAGMCLVMVWDMMLWGIVAGIVGIVMLLFLIPICKGLK